MVSVVMDQMLLLLSFRIKICSKLDLVWIMIFFLLRKANVGIAVTDLTMVLFLFFFKKSMVFVNSPATSTQFRH